MNQANSQAVTSTTWSTISGSIVTASIDGSNSVLGLAHAATNTNSINGAQQQQKVVIAYIQLPNGENVEGRVSQIIINVDGAASVSWLEASTVDVQGIAELQPANVIQQQDFDVACLQDVQVQDGQAQQIISNDRSLHRRELSPNAINGIQQQQDLVYFQQANDQNFKGLVSQIVDVDEAADVSWPGASAADVQGTADIQRTNAIQEQDFSVACLQEVQVQDRQAQQIISNDRSLHRRELSPNAINGIQKQQDLVYFQQANDQNFKGLVSQIIDVDGAAAVSWPGASAADVQGAAEIQHKNAIQEQDFSVACSQEVQVQDGQAQQIISNDRSLHRRELSPNAINGIQQQQDLVYFQQANDQNVKGLVSQIIDVDEAADVSWPGASAADVQGAAEIQRTNAIQEQDFSVACLQEVQVQDGQAQQIISNDRPLHRRELSPNAINGIQQQQDLVYFQQANDQNFKGLVSQIIDVDVAAAVSWPGASAADVQGAAEIQHKNAIQEQDFSVACSQEVQVQGGQAQEIISNDRSLHRRELSPNAINGIQQQQDLVYFQQSNDQNIKVLVSQIIDVDGAAAVSWPGASAADVQGAADIQHKNAIQEQDFSVACSQEVQVQDGQAQQIISNDRSLHRRELSPNAINGIQQQQDLVYFQQANDQNVKGLVSQIIDVDEAADVSWPGASAADVQGAAEIQRTNAIQEQDFSVACSQEVQGQGGQAQEIISNDRSLHRRELSPNAINGIQQQQDLVYFQQSNDQNIKVLVSQIIDVDGAAAVSGSGASAVDVKGAAELQRANAIQEQDFSVACLQEVQVQDGQAQQIISNDRSLHRRELSPNAINGIQQQQDLVYFQQSNDQNFKGLVSQIIDVDRAAVVSWPGASTVDVQGAAELQRANAIQEQDFAVACFQDVQVQDGQAQKIISNDRSLHRRELSPNAINGIQQQQDLVYFQTSNDQNIKGLVSQIIDVDGAAAVSGSGASTVDVQSTAQLQRANAIQEQDFAVACFQEVQVNDGQAQEIISNDRSLHRRKVSPNAINGVQQQHALVYFQQSNDQNCKGLVSQIIDVDRAAFVSWPGASTVDVQGAAELQRANAIQEQDFAVACFQDIQVQDGQSQQIISNVRTLHSQELSPNALAAWPITSTSSHQQMTLLTCIQTVYAGAQESLQLQKDVNVTEKRQVLASATNPATVSSPFQNSQVSESVAPNLVIAVTSTTSTSAESQSLNSPLNAPRLRTQNACLCINCNDQDEKNKIFKKKEHPCHAPGCTKVFPRTSKLLKHYRCHTGERPFVCSWTSCGEKFRRLHHLQSHLRSHRGEKKFQCSVCFRRFTRNYHLSRHFKSYHNK